MANRRIYYPVHSVAIAPLGTTNYTTSHVVRGLQNAGSTLTFNLEQIFEIGQLEIYENIESVPIIEITLEKVFDGYPLIYHLATVGATDPSLAGRQNAPARQSRREPVERSRPRPSAESNLDIRAAK